VTASSVIVLQYVGTASKSGKVELSVASVTAGQFTVQGAEGRQFRYVVFN
jgi:hypothetical protein